jgi:hypothetical protein
MYEAKPEKGNLWLLLLYSSLIMHTNKAKALCIAREVPVTGSQSFSLSAIYQGSTKASD